MDKTLTESKKGTGMLAALIAGILASAAAVAAGPAGVAVLPQVLIFIGSVCGAHQLAQGAQDVTNALSNKIPNTQNPPAALAGESEQEIK